MYAPVVRFHGMNRSAIEIIDESPKKECLDLKPDMTIESIPMPCQAKSSFFTRLCRKNLFPLIKSFSSSSKLNGSAS